MGLLVAAAPCCRPDCCALPSLPPSVSPKSVFSKINGSDSLRARLAVGAVCATVAAGGVMGVAMHKTVTIDVDGKTRQVSTMAMSVESLLESEGLAPAGGGDKVSPSLDSGFGERQTITVNRLKKLTLDVEASARRSSPTPRPWTSSSPNAD